MIRMLREQVHRLHRRAKTDYHLQSLRGHSPGEWVREKEGRRTTKAATQRTPPPLVLCAAVRADAQLLLTRVVQELYKPLHECPGITVTDEYWFDMMHVVSRSTLCCALLARLSHTCRVHAAVLGAGVWVGLAGPVDTILTSRGGGRAARCATNAGRHGGGQWDRRRGARRGG